MVHFRPLGWFYFSLCCSWGFEHSALWKNYWDEKVVSLYPTPSLMIWPLVIVFMLFNHLPHPKVILLSSSLLLLWCFALAGIERLGLLVYQCSCLRVVPICFLLQCHWFICLIFHFFLNWDVVVFIFYISFQLGLQSMLHLDFKMVFLVSPFVVD